VLSGSVSSFITFILVRVGRLHSARSINDFAQFRTNSRRKVSTCFVQGIVDGIGVACDHGSAARCRPVTKALAQLPYAIIGT
jgi:hypothetical protein